VAGGLSLSVVLRLLGLAGVAAVAWGVLAAYRATRVPRYRLDLTPADFHLPFGLLTLTTADGIRLTGWRLVPPSPRGVVLVQHGYGTCRADPLRLIALVYEGGYAVVSVDFRGHGESGGHCTFGRQERLDVQAMVEAVAADQRLRRLPIGYLGISMGAAVGMLAAAEDPRIQAVVSDSSYARLAPMVWRYQRMAYGLPEAPFGWITGACLACALGVPLSSLDPARAVRMLRCPLMIIHGAEDLSIPVSHARELHAAAAGPKELWIVPGAGHVASVDQAGAEYPRRVMAFLERSLHLS